MYRPWHHKPGDKIVHRLRIQRDRPRRTLGIRALFTAGYGDFGSSIYYALGIVALAAWGATPIALAIAGVLYVLNALTYAEGSAMLPEAGGAAAFARSAFNDFISFIAAWALMLSYIATMAITAYTIPPYLSYFWPPLADPVIGTATSMGIIFFLMLTNVSGLSLRESSRGNAVLIGVNIATQLSLVVLGLLLILFRDPSTLSQHMFGGGNWPAPHNLVLGIALAALTFTGVETVSQMSEEARRPATQTPRAYILMTVPTLLLFAGISIVAFSAMPAIGPDGLASDWAREPIAGIAAHLPSAMLQSIYRPLVGALAATILLAATNAGLMGISRLAFSLGTHNQMPQALCRVHPRFRTPSVSLALFGFIAILTLIPGFFIPNLFSHLGALYCFGSLLCFAIGHASIIALRVKKADLPRPFKAGPSIKVKGYHIPLSAVLGLIGTAGIWLVILIWHRYGRLIGFGWMLLGIFAYYIYRTGKRHSRGRAIPSGVPGNSTLH